MPEKKRYSDIAKYMLASWKQVGIIVSQGRNSVKILINVEEGRLFMKLKFDVTGMTCSACSARVESVTGKLPGVKSAAVNLLGGSMLVVYDENVISSDRIHVACG